MITFFRKFLTSWFALGLLGLVVIAFAVTGVGDPFAGPTGAASGSVATVGGKDIGETRLLAEFDRVLRRARQSDPKLTAQDAAREGAVGEVSEQLIASTAIEQFGRTLGIAVSDRAIDGEIASVDAFRVGGKFDQDTYRRLLSEQRLSERDLRDGLHGDLVRKQMVTPVLAGTQVPRAMAMPYAAVLLERREGAIGIVPVTAAPVPPAPTPTDLAAFYKQVAARFTVPERRAFRYALVDRDRIAGAVTIADADVQKYYDANRETYGGVEQRKLAQVVVPEEARARAIAAEITGGKSFAAAASAAGFAPADTDIGTQTQTKFAAATSPAVAAAAFAVRAGGVTAPVQSPFGWHVVQAVAIETAKSRSLAEAKSEIVAKLKAERGEQALSDAVGKIEDALSSSTSFADVAKTYGLTIVAVPPVTREGSNPADPGFALPAPVQPLVAKAFAADPADGAQLQQLAKDQFAVLELGDVVPPAPVPLDKVRDQVTAAWIGNQRLVAARAIADAIIADVAKGKPLAEAMAARKLPAPKPLAGRRVDLASQPQVPPPVTAFLTTPKGGTRAIPAPGNQGFWIVHVDTITPGDPATAPQLVDSARAQFAQTAPDELGAAFAQAVEREVGVKRNAAGLAAAQRRIVGETTPQ